MTATEFELDTLLGLLARLQRDQRSHDTAGGIRVPGLRVLRAYYKGMQRLEQLGLAVPEDLRRFTTVVAWPRTYVDSIADRLHPQGFLVNGEADAELWRWWQTNNLDSEIRMALVDMLVYGRGYLCIGSNDEDDTAPLITVESPMQMIHTWSNRERAITAAARFYNEEPAFPGGFREQHATLYLPNTTVWLVQDQGRWVETDRDNHNLGKTPVAVLVNRPQSNDRYGESEMLPIITLTDAAARALTNAQVATEVMALPQRHAAGMTAADFKDPATGEMLTAWESYFGAVWATTNPDAKFGQFAAADLANFSTIVSLYAKLVAGVTGLPMRYLGQISENPVSADAIRADESRLVGTAENKQEFANAGLEDGMRKGRRVVTGKSDPADDEMSTVWRPAATPSQAQAADAAVKLHMQRLISRREVLRLLGKSPQQIQTIEDEMRAEELDPIAQTILKDMSTLPVVVPPVETGNAGPNPQLNA